ncbi:MAG TPA: PfkB family carbohydrate kinase [Gaiellaceae bacterium]|jgi:ribokinase|nr:PfkB family carbohydrate kinase [Gaiellaceae bacterium]
MRFAVVGHVEWVEFAKVERLPQQGEIVQASDWWAEAAGGGGVASVRLARLGERSTLFTALGRDPLGDAALAQLTGLGVRVEASRHPEPQRRGFTFVDAAGERTITIIGEKHVPRGSDPLPWDELAETDGVYFVSGDAAAAREARRARVLVATARVLPVLAEAGVELDVLVLSAKDPSERFEPGNLDPPPRLVVRTAGEDGGSWAAGDGASGAYAPAPIPGPVADSYGAGDSFAAGLTYAFAAGKSREQALAFAAGAASEALTRRGAHGLS